MARKTQQSRGRAQRRALSVKDWRRREIGRDNRDAFYRKVEITIEDEFTATLGLPQDNLDFTVEFSN